MVWQETGWLRRVAQRLRGEDPAKQAKKALKRAAIRERDLAATGQRAKKKERKQRFERDRCSAAALAPESAPDPKTIVSEYWAVDRKMERPLSWLEHKTVLEFVHRRATGSPQKSTYQWFKESYFPQPAELALSLGCGLGGFERTAIAIGLARRFQANDLSAGAIEKAKASALEAGMADKIEYSVANLNEIVLPPATYDAIFGISSVHHVFELERLFAQCRQALKPGALLFLDEYIGPSRFQTTPFVTDLINRLLAVLPPRYRTSQFTNDGRTIDCYTPSTIEHFEKFDPSEAVRSGEIINALKLHFDIVEIRPYGGTILHMLMSGITGNFDENVDIDAVLIQIIATFEEALEEAGAIQSDFAAIVAKSRTL